jgi:chorismate mutase
MNDVVLQRLRAEIDATDRELAGLLRQRAALVRQIWQHKDQTGVPRQDPVREQQIGDVYVANCPELDAVAVRACVTAVLRASAP